MKGNLEWKPIRAKKKRGRPRIRTAKYWREYYRQKQREWRAVHLYGVSRKAAIRVFGEGGKSNRDALINGREFPGHKSYPRQKDIRRAAKRDSSLRK
jgi:hypothetical protein